MFIEQIFLTATARASEVSYRSSRNHPILGESDTSIRSETCFLSIQASRVPPSLPLGELPLVSTPTQNPVIKCK